MYTLEDIQAVDPEIAAAITAEFDRQNSHIELIASENWVSPAVDRKSTRLNSSHPSSSRMPSSA